ncbi:MAG: cytochrome oxidase [Gammaproteobacteria bacterium]|nr:cytochrome oxidase [Gammaproteobacteria bacterium]
MNYLAEEKRLIKFLVASAACFFIGTVHGVLQVVRPIRHWLDSIGSPYGGPGHMIDPLAHAHMNVIGGVVIFLMAGTYFMLGRISQKPLYSYKLLEHTFWWTFIGILSFYSVLMVFGYLEGVALLEHGTEAQAEIHKHYGPLITISANVMGLGFWIFFFNVFKTYRMHKL